MHLDYSQKIPCLILIDCLDPQDEAQNQEVLNALQAFQSILVKDSHLTDALDICIMSCGEAVNVALDFTPGSQFQIPTICTSTQYNLNTALTMALAKLDKRANQYRENNVLFTTPLLILVSNGLTADQIFEEETLERLHTSIWCEHVAFVTMGLGNADLHCLARYYHPNTMYTPILGTSAAEFRDVMPSFWRSDDIPIPPIPHTLSIGI